MINYNIENPMNAFLNSAVGLQKLQANQIDIDNAMMKQKSIQEAAQNQADLMNQFGQLDFSNQDQLQQFIQQNPEMLEQVKSVSSFGDSAKNKQALEAATQFDRALNSGNPELIESTINSIAPIIDNNGDPTFTSDTVRQMAQTPQGIKQLKLMSQGYIAELGGKDYLSQTSLTPQQQANNDLDERKFELEEKKYKSKSQGGGSGATSSMKDFKYYQDLKKTDPEAAQQYGRQKGYISKAGEELPVFQQKNLDTAQTTAMESESKANSLDDLATQFTTNADELGGGMFGSWKDGLKTATGSEDAVSSLRRAWIATKNKETMQSLPPGAASDTDIKMAQGGFLSNDANPQEVASFLRGLAKIERYKSEYNNFKAEYISEKGDTRGLLKAWKNQSKESQDKDKTSTGKSENYTTKSGLPFTVEG